MKVRHENGMVTFRMRTGRSFVRHKMSITSANYIINQSDNVFEKDGEIVVDNTYFFPMHITTKSKKRKGIAE